MDTPGCYTNDKGGYVISSIGIGNAGQLIFNSGYVFGTHSGISTYNDSKTYINGGTFEGASHGGLYFAHWVNGEAYIENATIAGTDYKGSYTRTGKEEGTLEEIKSAFYIGGNADENGTNVYMNNCNILAKGNNLFVLRGTQGERNLKLYLSNCKLQENKNLRIDDVSDKVYFGKGNNFDISKFTLVCSWKSEMWMKEDISKIIEYTNEIYIKNR